jgi:hypothetical protein
LFDEFLDVFQPLEGLPPILYIQHPIDLVLGTSLLNALAYRFYLPLKLPKLNARFNPFLHLAISNHILPIAAFFLPFFLRKKHNNDVSSQYFALNTINVKNYYPLPWIDDLLDHLKGAKFFTKMDLIACYH